MNKWGKVYLIATIVAAVVSICIILYRETNVFKYIIDGISYAYNWIKTLGHPETLEPSEVEAPVEEAVKMLVALIKK